jgi:hypothetical protein
MQLFCRFFIILVTICIFSSYSAVFASGLDSEINNVLLTEKDFPGYKLLQQIKLADTWPIIKDLPDIMRYPENPPSGSGGNALDILTGASLSMNKNDGIRQDWGGINDRSWVFIEYGYYSYNDQAINSLKYMVYERGIPLYSCYAYPRNPYFPVYSNYPYAQNIPVCRKINIGDLGYFVSSPTGGCIMFVKGHCIFMVDSCRQDLEDKVAGILVKKAK